MTIQEIRTLTNLSQPQFCEKYHIPLPTLRKWEQGKREPPDYLVELLEFKVREDMLMEELKSYLENEIEKTRKLLNQEEEKKKQNSGNPMFDNETSITCLGSMLVAYKNVLDKILV